jgi:DNA-binding NtrC family response regulator
MNKGTSKYDKYEQDFIWESLDEIWGSPGSPKELSVTALPEYLKEIELNEITDALNMHNGNVAAASRHLGVGRTRLIARMKVLKIKGR